MKLLIILIALVWIYLLSVLHRAKLTFFKFLVGSVGLFLLMMLTIRSVLTQPLAQAVTAVTGLFGDWTGMFRAYYQYAILFINHAGESISLYVDYECSGIIELMAFIALLAFFPLYRLSEKIVVGIGGVLWIFASNVLRLLLVCTIVYFFGNNAFFFAHAIFGRILFYGLTIILYFHVFTRSQILRQKVGKFNYGNDA